MNKEKAFVEELVKRQSEGHEIGQRDVMVFNVNGEFGHYSVKIGPETTSRKNGRKCVKRAIEIDGEVHHLFITKGHASPFPEEDEVNHNMKHTLIVKGIRVHFTSLDCGRAKLKIETEKRSSFVPSEKINLAGEEGDKMMELLDKSSDIIHETMMIVKEDILKNT